MSGDDRQNSPSISRQNRPSATEAGSLSCLFLLSRGDVVNGTKLLKQRIKALVDVLLCIP